MHRYTVGRVFAMLDSAISYLIMTNPYGGGDEKKEAETDGASFAIAAGTAMRKGDVSTLPPSLRAMMAATPKPSA